MNAVTKTTYLPKGLAGRFSEVNAPTATGSMQFQLGDCVTQKQFDTICSQGRKFEGQVVTAFPSAEAAWDAWEQAIAEYLAGHEGQTVYWRHAPKLEKAIPEGFFVYSRVLVSGSTPIQNAEGSQTPLINVAAPRKGEAGWRATKGYNPANRSGFRATGHRLLLVADAVEKTTESGIILQSKTVQAEQNLAVQATVIEIGHDCWLDKVADYCEVGDRVLVGQYAGKFHTSEVDGKVYRFINDLDIITPIEAAGD